MKILFSPAKTFKEGIIDSNIFSFKDKTIKIIDIISSWDKKEFINNFKISDKIYDEVYNYYHLFTENPAYKVYSLYNGQSFISLDFESLNAEARDYIFDNVVILDALYGILKFNDSIKKYRLDYNTKIINPKEIWVDEFNNALSNVIILSLASEEFTSLIKSNNLYKLSFVDMINGKRRKISVTNKQMRGKLLRLIALNGIDCIDKLPNNIDGYRKIINGKEIEYIKE